MDFRELIDFFEAGANSAHIRDLLLNYSKTTIGHRNRYGPVGFVARDQGQADAYAGRSRMILSVDGTTMLMAAQTGILADLISLQPKSVQTLLLHGRTINPKVHQGQQVAALKTPLDDLWLVGSPPRCHPETGEIINPIPLSSVIEPMTVFDPPTALADAATERFNELDKALWGK